MREKMQKKLPLMNLAIDHDQASQMLLNDVQIAFKWTPKVE